MTRRTSSANVFDEASYAIIVSLLDSAEERLIEQGICEPEAAQAYVTLEYIKSVAGLSNGASTYVTCDERMAAEFFLLKLPGGKKLFDSHRRSKACVDMLFTEPSMFFPQFGVLLRHILTLELKRTFPKQLQMNGIINLAAATLPGALAEIRREMRRRGENERHKELSINLDQTIITLCSAMFSTCQ